MVDEQAQHPAGIEISSAIKGIMCCLDPPPSSEELEWATHFRRAKSITDKQYKVAIPATGFNVEDAAARLTRDDPKAFGKYCAEYGAAVAYIPGCKVSVRGLDILTTARTKLPRGP